MKRWTKKKPDLKLFRVLHQNLLSAVDDAAEEQEQAGGAKVQPFDSAGLGLVRILLGLFPNFLDLLFYWLQ